MEPIVGVGGEFLLPERLGDYAKHGSAVEVVESVGDDGKFEIAKRGAVQRLLRGKEKSDRS
jgi:hypothetical protein